MELRKLTREDVEIKLEALEEDIPVRGNAIDSGNKEHDRQVEDQILKDLEEGNEWAWCCARVAVKWGQFRSVVHLGACSYANEEDFKKGGYYEDMILEALEDLNKQVAQAAESIAKLEVKNV